MRVPRIPLDASFRREEDNGDLSCALSAVTNEDHRKLMTNGCLGFSL